MISEDLEGATRAAVRVALVTCAAFAALDVDDHLLVEALARYGVTVEPAVWDDPDVVWADYDLAVLRSTWDYPPRRDEFVAWAQRVPALANPAEIVAWNTDKRYLDDLVGSGLPVVPTTWIAPTDPVRLPAGGEYVIKPAVSVGSKDTGRYDLSDQEHRRLAGEHLDRLRAAGRLAMMQPYLPAVDMDGETALLFHAGPEGLIFSHAIRKGPMLDGPDRGQPNPNLYVVENITPRVPTSQQREVAERVLAAVPGDPTRLLYARVDLIPGPDGAPLLIELELTEPSLFLATAAGAADRFAAGIAAAVTRVAT